MHPQLLQAIRDGLHTGTVAPYLGPGVMADVVDVDNGEPMPADSDSLILAMNNGRSLSPRLMYEFPRAAMHLEQRRGRSFVEGFLTRLYGHRNWSRSAFHEWVRDHRPPYVIDINRDTQLLDSYADTPHILIMGTARIMGTEYRFQLYQYNGHDYRTTTQEDADWSVPILFKPMGAPLPEPSYIASDADYVDYLTELMGGFAIPRHLKGYRHGLRYLFIGLRFTRDTERMVMSDICRDGGSPLGWALIPDPTSKERRFCRRMGITLIEEDPEVLLEPTHNSVAMN